MKNITHASYINFHVRYCLQKILVMPNMDDVWLTVMHSAMDPRSDATAAENKGAKTVPETDVLPPEGP